LATTRSVRQDATEEAIVGRDVTAQSEDSLGAGRTSAIQGHVYNGRRRVQIVAQCCDSSDTVDQKEDTLLRVCDRVCLQTPV